MCEAVFEKVQSRVGKVKRTSFMQKQPSEGFLKKDFVGNFAEFTKKETSVPESLF